MDAIPIETHPLSPFLPQNPILLMLGSFPPQQKRWSVNFFYPNFNNDMWRIFGYIFKADRNYFVNSQAKKFNLDLLIPFLTQHHIGIYDTATAVRRLKDNASDKFLEVVTPTDVAAILSENKSIQAVVTTGEKATQILMERFQCEQPEIGKYSLFEHEKRSIRFYRMPSSSRAYPLKLEKKSEHYRNMFKEIGILQE